MSAVEPGRVQPEDAENAASSPLYVQALAALADGTLAPRTARRRRRKGDETEPARLSSSEDACHPEDLPMSGPAMVYVLWSNDRHGYALAPDGVFVTRDQARARRQDLQRQRPEDKFHIHEFPAP